MDDLTFHHGPVIRAHVSATARRRVFVVMLAVTLIYVAARSRCPGVDDAQWTARCRAVATEGATLHADAR